MGIGEDNRKSKMKTLSRKERKTKNQHDFQHDFLFFMMITKMDVIMMITMFRIRIKHSQLIFVWNIYFIIFATYSVINK